MPLFLYIQSNEQIEEQTPVGLSFQTIEQSSEQSVDMECALAASIQEV